MSKITGRELEAEREEISSQIISFFKHAYIKSGTTSINQNLAFEVDNYRLEKDKFKEMIGLLGH